MRSHLGSLLRASLAGLASLILSCVALAAQLSTTGIVVDERGAPVADAVVTVTTPAGTTTARTDASGRFSVADEGAGTVSIAASGFAVLKADWRPGETYTLAPAPFGETVVVTADRTATRVGETASSVVALTRRDLDTSPAVTLDGALRQVPGFQLFRRTDSRAANPTAQGASLRGVAPSGASRTTVVVDGVPLNDPFGGWVYWSRVPRAEVERVEVARGGASALYGSDALGGVVQMITERPRGTGAWLDAQGSVGSLSTSEASVAAGGAWRGWTGSVAGEAFDTDGWVLVDEDERGPVDTPAGSQHGTLSASIGREIDARTRVFLRGSAFREDRANGTPATINRTHTRELVAGLDWTSELLGAFDLRAYGSAQVYDQTFSAVADDRASEAFIRSQRVPAQQFGVSLGWQRPVAERHTILAGVETREVRGASDEVGYFGGNATSASGSGGRQRTVGVYGEGIFRLADPLTLTVGGRADHWRDYDALSTSRVLSTGVVTTKDFDDRTETAFSPRAALVYAVTSHLSLTASGYRAFRAPTLNELYRGFRVGNVTTLANADLRAERLTGGEAGARFDAFDGRFAARSTFFWSEVTRPVANVTLSVTPDLITRIRQNLGRTRARGVEVDVETRLGRDVELSGGYAYADSTVLRFEASPALEGLRVPQVPRHYGSVQARYSAPWRLTFAAVGRFSSSQFDDDQNRLRLGGYGTLDLYASRSFGPFFEAFVAGENVTDTRYEVGKTPVTTIGPPASVRVGARVRIR